MRTPDDRISLDEMRARRDKQRRKNRRRLRRQERLGKIAVVLMLAWILFWTALIATGAFLAVRWLWLETM